MDALTYPDALIARILRTVNTIAMVGASTNWNRPSYFVMKYLQGKGYRVIPVNPGAAGQQLLGETVRGSLAEIAEPVDMVEIFRKSDAVPPIVDEAIARKIPVVWMQLGVRHDAAAAKAEAAGLTVIMDRCPKIEFGRLGGELSWSGVDSGIISSKRREAPKPAVKKRAETEPERADHVFGFETRSVHAGAAPDPVTGARITPIYQTASYVFEDADQAASLFNLHTFGHVYSRLSNPTVAVLEERLANLEGGRAAVAAASGHAAQFLTFFTLLEPGDEFIASRNLYGGSLTQFGLSFKRLGWTCHFVDPTDPDNFRKALTPRTKAIFVESLANPGGVVVDLEAVAKVAHEAGIPFIVDNTLATPFLCQPIAWGADIVCHSTTKFLGGHGNSLGGVVIEFGKIRLGPLRQISVDDRAGTRLSRLEFSRDFWRFRLHHQGARRGLARFRPRVVADERLPDADGNRNPAAAHGAPCRQCRASRRISRRPCKGRLGFLCRPQVEPFPRSRPKISAQRAGRGVHLRRQGRL